MSTATTLALSALLPHLTPSTLPPRLIDAADSLVALSRQRAPTLKRDEEIARAHACAEIACGRLREKLRLPPVKTATAPASKKAYAKLLRFLEEVLGREPVVAVAQKGRGNAAAVADIHVPTNDPSEAPLFVLPLVRELCAHFRTPSMAHHVYIGCIVALTRPGHGGVDDGAHTHDEGEDGEDAVS
ncbi:hypothetical protein DV736_g2073, partial [Chaetothyriales sp. CBS 134916]